MMGVARHAGMLAGRTAPHQYLLRHVCLHPCHLEKMTHGLFLGSAWMHTREGSCLILLLI